MRVRQIENVNEVADTGPVSRLIISTEDLKVGPAAQGRLYGEGHGVSFR